MPRLPQSWLSLVAAICRGVLPLGVGLGFYTIKSAETVQPGSKGPTTSLNRTWTESA